MEEIKQEQTRRQKAFLVGIQNQQWNRSEVEDHLVELASLTETLDIEVLGQEVVRIDRPVAKLYLGTGKAEQVRARAQTSGADLLIFDVELSPLQQRNWETFAEVETIDRQEVIIDIFAQRAHTREARLQVELAQLQYQLPRLRHAWSHLERQRGGTMHRGGPGERQIEVDRRRIREQITRSRRQLKDLRRQRDLRRQSRRDRPVPTAAIVGYTNAGKSSLLRRLTNAEVLIEDKLFATLDTTTRRITLPNNQPLLLTDTVGFIRKLPHQLVESFKATLEEATEADFLIHVLDVTHPKAGEHARVTMDVLEELAAGGKLMIVVLNKMDLPHDPLQVNQLQREYELCVPVSTHTGEGIQDLLDALARHFVLPLKQYELVIPHERFDLVDLVHREGEILEENHEADGAHIETVFPERFQAQIEPFITNGRDTD